MRHLIFLLASIMPLIVAAQQPEQAIAKVSYSFSHIKDTTQRDRPYKENMLLIIGKNASLFTSADRLAQSERMTNLIKQQTKANGGTLSNVVMQKGLMRPVSFTDLYFFANEQKTVTIENIREKYRIDEDAPKINWKITKDTTNFSGIHCQKATTYFKGRNWIAWFSPDLPFPSGPWKLNSLPGLIIEAYDEHRDVQFNFLGLEKISDTTLIKKNETVGIGTGTMVIERDSYFGKEIRIPSNVIKGTRAEIDRLKNALTANPAAGLNSQSGGTTTVKRISGPSTPSTSIKSTYNNPIELPEKKD